MQTNGPRPSSPYRPSVHRSKHTVLPSLFSYKMDMITLNATRDWRDANKEVEAVMEKVNRSPKMTLGRPRLGDIMAAAAKEQRAAEEKPGVQQAIREHFLAEAMRQQIVRAEESLRSNCIAEEKLVFTRMLVDSCQILSELVTASPELRREARIAKHERSVERENYMNEIAAVASSCVAARCFKVKVKELTAQWLQEHALGVAAIVKGEMEALEDLFVWEQQHHPQDRTRMMKDDPRLRGLPKKRSRYKKQTKTELAIKRIRDSQQQKSGVLVVFDEDARGEAQYREEGKRWYLTTKAQIEVATKKDHALDEVWATEVTDRDHLTDTESTTWVPLLIHGVDGHYEAQADARQRQRAEEHAAKKAKEQAELLLDEQYNVIMEEDKAALVRDTENPDEQYHETGEGSDPVTSRGVQLEQCTAETVEGGDDFSCDGAANSGKQPVDDMGLCDCPNESTDCSHPEGESSEGEVPPMPATFAEYEVDVVVADHTQKEPNLSREYLETELFATDLVMSKVLSDILNEEIHEDLHHNGLVALIAEWMARRGALIREEIETVLHLNKSMN